jgi:hypothetical protein
MRKVIELFQEHLDQLKIKPKNGRKSMEEIDELLEQIYYTKERLCDSVKEIDAIVNGVNND